ncbi:MAG: hypothetical protein WC655_29485 [Candidatus Hydrogenedentales bacterium]|jgi:hypothetical protein
MEWYVAPPESLYAIFYGSNADAMAKTVQDFADSEQLGNCLGQLLGAAVYGDNFAEAQQADELAAQIKAENAVLEQIHIRRDKMDGSVAVEVALGLMFCFASLSVIVSGIMEIFARTLNLRAKCLEEGLRSILAGSQNVTVDGILKHPLLTVLAQPKSGKPSYIPSNTFALALLDILSVKKDDNGLLAASNLDPAPLGGEEPNLTKAIKTLLAAADGNAEVMRTQVEKWFDATMDRASGWYKRRTQWTILLTSIVVVCAGNVDAINIGEKLWNQPELRNSINAGMEQALDKWKPTEGDDKEHVSDELARFIIGRLPGSGLPLGWSSEDFSESTYENFIKLIGLTLSAAAASMGAPFWFDAIGKLVNLRAAGKVPVKSGTSA